MNGPFAPTLTRLCLSLSLLLPSLTAASNRVRPYYHPTTPHGGLNDPNGLFFHRGVYHLFHQWHEPPAIPVDWYHQTSTDLIRWTRMGPVGLPFTSGGAVEDEDGVPVLLLSVNGSEVHPAEPEDLSDPKLTKWRLSERNLVAGARLPPGVPGIWDVSAFIAPDGSYRLVSGSCVKSSGNWSYCDGGHTPGNPQVMVLSSPGLSNGSTFRYSNIPWRGSNATYGPRTECPQMFQRGFVPEPQADGRTAGLLVSIPEFGQNLVFLGAYEDGELTGEFALSSSYPQGKVLDYGPVYAGQTLYDPSSDPPRRIYWGWVQGPKNCGPLCANRTWGGILSLPRVLRLIRINSTREGHGGANPADQYLIGSDVAPELEGLRLSPAILDQADFVLEAASERPVEIPPSLNGDSIEIMIRAAGAGIGSTSVSVRVSKDRREKTAVRYSPVTGLVVCTTNAMTPTPGRIPGQPDCAGAPAILSKHGADEGQPAKVDRLRIFVDATVLEVHVISSEGESVSLTQRIFPVLEDSVGVYFANDGPTRVTLGRVSIWGMGGIYEDELEL